MKCSRCENIICFSKPPFGAYFCKAGHVQCAECDLMSSCCAICGELAKYKSPHFIDEHTTDPKELERAKFQIPLIKDISPTKEEELEFQRLRYEHTIGKPKYFLGSKTDDEPNTVRTLSAIVTKNLYTSEDVMEKRQSDINESSSHELRLQRIIRTLRETRFKADEKELEEKTTANQKKCDDDEKIPLPKDSPKKFANLLTPTHSKLQANEKKLSTKIHIKVETCSESTAEAAAVGNKLKSLVCPHLMEQKLLGFPIAIESSSLDRRPFNCPLGNCGCKIFISELNNHITLDHAAMPLSELKVGHFREFSIDIATCENYFTPLSVVCFLLKDIVVNFGSLPLKDVLPTFLMVGRYSTCDALDKPKVVVSSDSHLVKPWSSKDFFLIWLAGVVADRCEIVASISVFSQENPTQSVRWYVDKMNSIQAIKDIETTFNGCERLILTYPELKLLTNNFTDMLQCQVGIISCELKTV